MQLAEPIPRWRVLAERAAELTVIDDRDLVRRHGRHPRPGASRRRSPSTSGSCSIATALLIPFALTFAAAGALLAGWRPRAAVVVLSTVAVISYLVFELGPLFKWPAWADNLSVFQLYGTPLITPVFVGGLIAMLAIVVVGFGSAGVALARRDVAA